MSRHVIQIAVHTHSFSGIWIKKKENEGAAAVVEFFIEVVASAAV